MSRTGPQVVFGQSLLVVAALAALGLFLVHDHLYNPAGLVVLALGTVALLDLAGLGLWLTWEGVWSWD